MLTWPSIIGYVRARIYDLLRRVFLEDLELLFGVLDLVEFLLVLTDGDTLGGRGSLSSASFIHLLYIFLTRFVFSASFSIASKNLARAICRATAFFISCILFLRSLLLSCECETYSTSSAAFLEALAASLFGIPSFFKSSEAYLGDDILLYKGRDNYSCSALASALASACA